MAKSKRGSLTPLRNGEFIAGLIFLPFYFGLTDLALRTILQLLGYKLGGGAYDLLLIFINFLATAVIFHHFLFQSLIYAGKNLWQFLQTVILSVVFFCVVCFAITWPLGKFGLLPRNLNNAGVVALYEKSFPITAVCICVFIPVLEECLFRGLIFGTIRKKSRFWAYLISALLFALIHTLPYLPASDSREAYQLGEFLLMSLPYLSAGLILGWAYEKSGTIWASILTHALINFIATFVTISF